MFSEVRYLRILPVNQSLLFYTPTLATENTACIVRTGTQRDIDNPIRAYVHAVLAGYSKQYRALSEISRCEFADKFLSSLYDDKSKLDDRLDEASKELVGFLANYKDPDSVSITLTSIAHAVTEFVVSDARDLVLFETVIPVLGNELVSLALKSTPPGSREVLQKSESLSKIGEENIESIAAKLDPLLVSIAESESERLRTELAEINDPLHPEFQVILAKKVQRDIYTLDSGTRGPVCASNTSYDKSLLILRVQTGDVPAYEILGELLEGNEIDRDLKSEHSFVQVVKAAARRT